MGFFQRTHSATDERSSLYRLNFGDVSVKSEALFCRAVFLSRRQGNALLPESLFSRSRLSTADRVLQNQRLAPPPKALNCIVRRRGKENEAFTYKKKEPLNRSIFLDPKRRFQTVHEHWHVDISYPESLLGAVSEKSMPRSMPDPSLDSAAVKSDVAGGMVTYAVALAEPSVAVTVCIAA